MKNHARGAALFALANVSAGVLHYLFQVWSASQLSLLEFGELTSWIAYFSITLSIGAFAQYSANFFLASPRTLKLSCWLILLISIASVFFPFRISEPGPFTIGAFGLTLGILFAWCLGQAQARLAFGVMGFAILITGIAKFSLAGVEFPVQSASLELAWAVALCYAPALIWLSAVLIILGPSWSRDAKKERGAAEGLAASALISFASVFIPQLDIIAINQTQDPEVIGEFARISLLYKAVFFGFLILAQWILPHQLAPEAHQPKVVRWLSASRWRVLALGMGQGIAALIVSIILGRMFMPQLIEKFQWLVLSCFNMVWLTNLFFSMQLYCVDDHLKKAGLILGALVLEMVIAIAMNFPVTEYLCFAIAVNMTLWWFLTRDPKIKGKLSYYR